LSADCDTRFMMHRRRDTAMDRTRRIAYQKPIEAPKLRDEC